MSSNTGQVTVSSTEDLRQALAAGKTPDQIAIASNDQAVANARAAGVEEGKKASTDIAVAAERKRIADVQALAREGFEAELKTAIDDGHSPEAFALSLMKAATERGITLDAMRKGAPAAASHGGKPEADAGKVGVRFHGYILPYPVGRRSDSGRVAGEIAGAQVRDVVRGVDGAGVGVGGAMREQIAHAVLRLSRRTSRRPAPPAHG